MAIRMRWHQVEDLFSAQDELAPDARDACRGAQEQAKRITVRPGRVDVPSEAPMGMNG
jgi:hypothetical protein